MESLIIKEKRGRDQIMEIGKRVSCDNVKETPFTTRIIQLDSQAPREPALINLFTGHNTLH